MIPTTKEKTASPPIDESQLEKYSSAVTLSDMEIFIYPELLYGLVLANIMSPRIWAWREDKWFAKLDKMTPYRRVMRLKQFIIDHYEFNLDLDTWGLTTKEAELTRFRPTMDEEAIAESNALFGYTGDQYYFDIDIRRHFGLDKYTTDTIPYWKTETVEAMDAFRYREGYKEGAGECVSLSTLYAAALFIVCRIPLDKIYLLATPLHSQNYVDVKDGILTNNRRVVTKNMWFNGTELTARAQRALRHEQVTIVAHHTGYIHVVYPEATIDEQAYEHLGAQLRDYLSTELTMEILANFLRDHSRLQSCFQIKHEYHGNPRYIAAEKVYSYEHGSSYKVSDKTRDKLLEEIDEYEYFTEPIEGRIPLSKFEEFFRQNPNVDLENERNQKNLMEAFNCYNARAQDILKELKEFVKIEPRLPHQGKKKSFVPSAPIALDPDATREEIISRLASLRESHPVVDLAFYAFRDLARTDWTPFLKAAVERNPVCATKSNAMSDAELLAFLEKLPNDSIYDGSRLAQPDEVWNYGRGDGLERALCAASVWKKRHPETPVELKVLPEQVSLSLGDHTVTWPSSKGLTQTATL